MFEKKKFNLHWEGDSWLNWEKMRHTRAESSIALIFYFNSKLSFLFKFFVAL